MEFVDKQYLDTLQGTETEYIRLKEPTRPRIVLNTVNTDDPVLVRACQEKYARSITTSSARFDTLAMEGKVYGDVPLHANVYVLSTYGEYLHLATAKTCEDLIMVQEDRQKARRMFLRIEYGGTLMGPLSKSVRDHQYFTLFFYANDVTHVLALKRQIRAGRKVIPPRNVEQGIDRTGWTGEKPVTRNLMHPSAEVPFGPPPTADLSTWEVDWDAIERRAPSRDSSIYRTPPRTPSRRRTRSSTPTEEEGERTN